MIPARCFWRRLLTFYIVIFNVFSVARGAIYERDPQPVANWPGYARGTIHKAVARDGFVYCAAGNGGLLILDARVGNSIQRASSHHLEGTATDIAVDGNFAYLATTIPGLQIYDVSNPHAPKMVGNLQVAGMVTEKVQVADGYAYLSDPPGQFASTWIVDVRNPARPKAVSSLHSDVLAIGAEKLYLADSSGLRVYGRTGTLPLQEIGHVFPQPLQMRSLAVEGNIVCATAGEDSLRIFDVSDAANPVLIKTLTGFEFPRSVTMSGGRAYVRQFGDRPIKIVDLSEPANPKIIGEIPAAGLETMSATVTGGKAYLSGYPFSLQVIDVMDPANPQTIGTYSENAGVSEEILVSGNRAYLGDWLTLRILDVSERSNPVEIGRREMAGISDVALVGSNLFVTSAEGLTMLDVSDAGNITERGKYLSTRPTDLEIAERTAYMAHPQQGLLMVDVSTPSQMRLLGRYTTTNNVTAVTVVSNTALVGTTRGLQIVDVSAPENARRIGLYNAGASVQVVKVSGKYAFVGVNGREVEVVDISDRTRPRRVAGGVQGDCRDLVVAGEIVYSARGMFGVEVYDMSNPLQPRTAGYYDHKVTTYSTAGDASAISLAGDFLFVADRSDGLHVLNVKRPANPQAALMYPLLGSSVSGMLVRGDRGYVAHTYGGFSILNLTNPAQPTTLGFAAAPGNSVCRNVAVQGNYAFLAEGAQGLGIFNITIPSAPVWLRTISTPTETLDVAANAHSAYVAVANGRVLRVDITNIQAARVAGTNDIPGGSNALDLDGDLLFVAAGSGGSRILDVSDPADLKVVADFQRMGVSVDVVVSDGFAYLAADQMLQIVDVREPTQPKLVGRIYFAGKNCPCRGGKRICLHCGRCRVGSD